MRLNGKGEQSLKRAVFLDRDGVINKGFLVDRIPIPARTLDQVEILPRVREAIKILRSLDFELVIVTNQPDVARGHLSKETVELIHRHLQTELGINHFYTCIHDDADNCACRKPKPGLITLAAEELGLNLKESFMVGDRWRDISAGQAANCKCFYIDYAYDERPPQLPYLKVSSLFDAAQLLLEENHDTISK